MARLPTVGGDDNGWGTVLNDFLGVEHKTDGFHSESLYNSMSNVAPVPGMFWTPPTQPSARAADAADFSGYGDTGNAEGWTYDQWIAVWERLRTAYPDYVSRSTPGTSDTGGYDFWTYVFAPPAYDTTMILTANMHGGEIVSTMGLYRLFYYICTAWKTYPQLSYLRHRVRFVVVPVANPWGFQNRQTKNGPTPTGVNLVHNFNYRFAVDTADAGPTTRTDNTSDFYRGPSAASEPETQYITSILSTYASSSSVYIDIHHQGASAQNIYYTPLRFDYDDLAIRQALVKFNPTQTAVVQAPTDWCLPLNFACSTHALHAILIEFPSGYFSTEFNATEMTKALEWYANVILQYANVREKPRVTGLQYPKTWYGYYSQTSTGIELASAGSHVELADLRLTLPMPGNGILEIVGECVIQNASGNTATLRVLPQVVQSGSDFANQEVQKHENFVIIPTGQYATIPFSAVARVLYSNTIATDPVEVQVRINAYSSHGFTFITRYRAMVTWLPNTSANGLQIYSAVDRVGQGAAAMVKEYPV